MKNCGDVVWYHVHKDTDFRIDAEWMRIVQKIKATAEILQFHLHEKAEDDTDTSLWRPPRSYATWDTDFYASMTLVSVSR